MRRERLVASALSALCISAAISFVMSVVNTGLGERFPFIWVRGWAIAFCLAFPLSYLLPPHMTRLAKRICARTGKGGGSANEQKPERPQPPSRENHPGCSSAEGRADS
ncbi:DUF2798 domain-containing protein [Berryella wangjianweii]|uniref:DUF2798 domain-containing protein n=1 Tax=Berryella wangjianweii TaxID=2734634 RepID=A0A6M8IZV3_9ACTN|nr:DUF2798 domain-containing protein [Berryella wangjianweii]QKF06864.1 DUF2798 domain-containing protein [Berryella wangjianweii]